MEAPSCVNRSNTASMEFLCKDLIIQQLENESVKV